MSLRALLVAAASAILCCARLVAQPCTPQFFGGFPALDGAVRCMAVYDDGTGPALFIGGSFTTAASGNDLPVSRIAKWTGSAWQAVSGGVNGTVYCMQVWDDGLGGGPGLYVGGNFNIAGGVTAKGIARLDATGWNDVGGGVELDPYPNHPTSQGEVRALALFDEGAGPTLFAGGDFDVAGGVRGWGVARWNGSVWSVVGPERLNAPGPTQYPNYFKPINALLSFTDTDGVPRLFAGGSFSAAGLPGYSTSSIPGLARWDGISWSPPSPGPGFTFTYNPTGSPLDRGGVYSLAASIDENQPTLFVGGRMRAYSGQGDEPRVYKYRASIGAISATNLYSLSSDTLYAVHALSPINIAGDLGLLIGGDFGAPEGNRIVLRLSNGAITSIGANSLGANGVVYTVATLQHPLTPGFYIGGGFTSIGGVSASRLARFGCAGASSPTAFPLLSPPHNALAQPQSPMFQWAPPGSASPVYYALRVYLDAAQTQLAYAQNNIVGASFTPPPMTFAPGTRYYWSVAASNINGSTPCAAPFSFATRSIGDCDGNGLVNFIDLNAVLSVFGQAP